MADDYGKGNKMESPTGGIGGGARAGGSSGENSGPTGSSRSYPKGKGGNVMRTDWNPMKKAASTYGICGV